MTTVALRRAYRFRIYPTKVQEAELSEWSRQLSVLWNLCHEQRLLALQRPRGEQPRIDYYRQSREMTELVRADCQLARVVCSARQEVLRDLDKAWQRWRKRLGGKPHFKSARRDFVRIYFSTPKHWAIAKATGRKRSLSFAGAASSVGAIEINLDREWPEAATLSSCHVTRDVDQWFAVFPLSFPHEVGRHKGGMVGINRGAIHAVADSDGRVVDSPAYYAHALERVRLLSRRLDRKQPGSRNAHKARLRLARLHRKIRRQREWFLHQQSDYYAKRYSLIGIEDWSTKDMTSSEPESPDQTRRVKRALNRSILDVGWYELGRQLEYKAQATGARVVKVDPGLQEAKPIVKVAPGGQAGISGTCSSCGGVLEESASGRKRMLCDVCHSEQLGDVNAATNVLLRAMRFKEPSSPKTPKASIKIKGRKKRPVTTVNPTVEASGGDRSAGRPIEGGTPERELRHHAGTVLPDSTGATHPPIEHGD